MDYTIEQLKNDVAYEANNLRIQATDTEKARLNVESLDPKLSFRCIYGLMTSDCYSERASELINACACRLVKDDYITGIANEGFERIKRNINGKHLDNLHENRTGTNETAHYSAIEAYILLPDANNENLINFIKGQTDTLNL